LEAAYLILKAAEKEVLQSECRCLCTSFPTISQNHLWWTYSDLIESSLYIHKYNLKHWQSLKSKLLSWYNKFLLHVLLSIIQMKCFTTQLQFILAGI
jgi:hypothetical protein